MTQLIECRLCHKQISKHATRCPQCGDPRDWRFGLGILLLGIFFVVIPLIRAALGESTPQAVALNAPSNRALEPDKNPATQAIRKAHIDNLIENGFLLRIEHESSWPDLYLGPLFYATPKIDQNNWLRSVRDYFRAQHPKAGGLTLYDGGTSKLLGTYMTRNGVSLK